MFTLHRYIQGHLLDIGGYSSRSLSLHGTLCSARFCVMVYQTIGAVSFMLVGTYLYQYNILPNNFFYQHAFILVSFMFFGRILKEHEMRINSIAKRLLVPFVLLVLFLPLIGIEIPTVTRTITVKLSLPLFVVLSLGGSIIVWYLSRLISKSNWLEYIGKGSLVEYCFNYATLCLIANIYKETIKMGGNSLQKVSPAC